MPRRGDTTHAQTMRRRSSGRLLGALTLALLGLVGCADLTAAGDEPAPVCDDICGEVTDAGDDPAPVCDDICEEVTDAGDDPAPECDDIGTILARNSCTTCHDQTPEFNAGGLDLVSDGLAARLIDRPSVNPGCEHDVVVDLDEPEASLLLRSIHPEHYAGFGSAECTPPKMPLLGTRNVPAADVACVEQWIRSLERTESADLPVAGDAFTVLSKVKYLMHGAAITDAELQTVTGDDGTVVNSALETLVASWMATDPWKVKRRQFLELQLQQNPSDGNYFYQFRNTQVGSLAGWRDSMRLSMVRTAERIIDADEDFRTVVTTNTWEVTTGVLLALKMADNPMILKDNGVWPKNNHANDLKAVMAIEGLYDKAADVADWRTVTLVHNPDSTDWLTGDSLSGQTYLDFEASAMARAEYLRGIPDGGTVDLRAPRVGFFTTPAFFQTWITNADNEYRVTVNQAMIVATGRTFSPGDTTAVNTDESAIDPDLFPVGSECYGCHKNLDRMRTALLGSFDPINSRQWVPEPQVPEPDFTFQGHSAPVHTLNAWAAALASHPNFAKAWVVKLCQWATTSKCDPYDPKVNELAAEFAGSGYKLSHLIRKFFASRLVTDTSPMEGTRVPGAQVSVARKDHYCHAVKRRLTDVLEAQGRGYKGDADVCDINADIQTLRGALPNDAISRGEVYLHQPKSMEPMTAVAFEGLCALSAASVVDDKNAGVFRGDDPTETLDLMTSLVLGFPEGTPRFTESRATLKTIYDVQVAAPPCADASAVAASLDAASPTCGMGLSTLDALRNVWTIACQSPSLTGVGL